MCVGGGGALVGGGGEAEDQTDMGHLVYVLSPGLGMQMINVQPVHTSREKYQGI